MATKSGSVKPRKLTDPHIEALREFDTQGTYQDSVVHGLRIRVGVYRSTWIFKQWHRMRGRRSTTVRTLGTWPLMNVATARKEALQIAGRIAGGKIEPSRREAVKFGAAFEKYLDHLRAQAERRGKPPRWAKNVKKLGNSIILPEFGSWTLVELSKSPAVVADWHVRATKKHGPVSANHAARVVRAAYRRAARLDRNLPPELPTSAVEFNPEKPSQKALDFKAFPKWLAAWRKIDSPIRRAYHLTALLIGPRPGELARLKWTDVKHNERNLVIGKAKAGEDIVIPMSDEIEAALRMARDAAGDEPGEFVFPGCAQRGHRDKLPARGNMLRHTYRTVAADLGIDDLLIHFLMGHAPEGISQKYVAILILSNGPAMRDAQAKISKRIVGLLGLTPAAFAKELRGAEKDWCRAI